MDTNCALLIADLFVYFYELQFIIKFSKDPSKLHLIDKFNNTYCYLGDVFSVNNNEFSKYTVYIYPKDLTLNKSKINGYNCPFSDLDISVYTRNYTLKFTTKWTIFVIYC